MNDCRNCSNSIFCPTWTEWKCTVKKVRYFDPESNCDKHIKRPKNWKDMKCRCEDCLKNDLLDVEIEEEKE